VTFQQRVAEFHAASGFHIGQFGDVPPLEVRRARAALVIEEARELAEELLSDTPQALLDLGVITQASIETGVFVPRPVDPVKVAHETGDVHYVASGGAVNFGFDEGPVFETVHAANMAKTYLADRDVGDEHGKARKPADWQPPDISAAMRPFMSTMDNVEAAARWLAQESGSARYDGDGWRMLLDAESNVDHAASLASRRRVTGVSAQDVQEAVEVLRGHLRELA
jgi:predicted HAD superfamily Cof-like phosphohydrolase